MTGYDYGNARVRAMKSQMLKQDDYDGLLGADDLSRLLGALGDTVYAPDVEAALVRYRGLRCLDEVVRTHLGSNLRRLVRFYDGNVRRRLGLLLQRWDLRNLRTILRGRIRLEGSEQIVRLLVPAGTIAATALHELASQPSLRTTLELMMVWNLPSQATAGRLLALWPEYEATGDPALLEQELNCAFAEHFAKVLADGPDDELERTLRLEIDQINVLSALRMRSARIDDEPVPESDPGAYFLPAGRIPVTAFERVWAADESTAAVEVLQQTVIAPAWKPALAAWSDDEDLEHLAAALDRATTTAVVGLFSSGDPLGIAIPLAFAWAKENEARNLRLIGRGVVHRLPREALEQRLVITS